MFFNFIPTPSLWKKQIMIPKILPIKYYNSIRMLEDLSVNIKNANNIKRADPVPEAPT
jgi:hypothetical protein